MVFQSHAHIYYPWFHSMVYCKRAWKHNTTTSTLFSFPGILMYCQFFTFTNLSHLCYHQHSSSKISSAAYTKSHRAIFTIHIRSSLGCSIHRHTKSSTLFPQFLKHWHPEVCFTFICRDNQHNCIKVKAFLPSCAELIQS